MKSWAKSIVNKVSRRTTRSSSQYASSRVGSDMSTDPPADAQPSSSSIAQRVLLTVTHLALRDAREKNIYNNLKSKNFVHTPVLDEVFLCETGIATELDTIFQFVGWSSFASITELGSKLLTIEFLCTLQLTQTGVSFRLFTQEFYLTW